MKTSLILRLADGSLMLALLALLAGAPPAVTQHFIFNSTLGVGNQPIAVVAADLNGDGRLDLISANHGDGALTVLTNDGHGGFILNRLGHSEGKTSTFV